MLHKKDMFGYAIVGLIVALFVVGLLGGSNVLNILPSSNYGYPAATPSVLLTATPTNGTAPLNVSFSVAVSGLYGSVTSVEWFFGNNVTGSTTGVNTTYIYKVAGTYTAHAVVTTTSSLYGNSTYPSNNVTISVFTGYAVTFTESGLASGTGWNVTLNNVTHSSTTGTITFTEVNGTYSYTVANVTGYTVSPLSGSVKVNGTNASVSVTFKSTTTTTATSSSTIILALTAIVIIAAIIIVVVAITRKKKTSEEGEEEETEETETEETPSEEEKPGNGGEEEQPSETSETDTTTTEQKE